MAAGGDEAAVADTDLAKLRAALGAVVEHFEGEVQSPGACALLAATRTLVRSTSLDPDRFAVAVESVRKAQAHNRHHGKHLHKLWRIVERGIGDIQGNLSLMNMGLSAEEKEIHKRAWDEGDRTLRKFREWMFWAFEEKRAAKGELTEAEMALFLCRPKP